MKLTKPHVTKEENADRQSMGTVKATLKEHNNLPKMGNTNVNQTPSPQATMHNRKATAPQSHSRCSTATTHNTRRPASQHESIRPLKPPQQPGDPSTIPQSTAPARTACNGEAAAAQSHNRCSTTTQSRTHRQAGACSRTRPRKAPRRPGNSPTVPRSTALAHTATTTHQQNR